MWSLMLRSRVGLVPINGTPDFLQGISNKVPEYLSAGLPIAVSFRSGLTRDLILSHNCGFAYDNDPHLLAKNLKMLYDSPERWREMAANASLLHATTFQASEIYPAMVGLVESLAGRIVRNQRDINSKPDV
jgi:glycosyltransferase involved in cell wall biosynthesis